MTSVAFVAVWKGEIRNSAVVRRWRIGKPHTRSPDILSANGPILASETESVKSEVGVEGNAGRSADGGSRECEEEKREEGGEPGHC